MKNDMIFVSQLSRRNEGNIPEIKISFLEMEKEKLM